jgi:hypothetical protein
MRVSGIFTRMSTSNTTSVAGERVTPYLSPPSINFFNFVKRMMSGQKLKNAHDILQITY